MLKTFAGNAASEAAARAEFARVYPRWILVSITTEKGERNNYVEYAITAAYVTLGDDWDQAPEGWEGPDNDNHLVGIQAYSTRTKGWPSSATPADPCGSGAAALPTSTAGEASRRR
jgi:hypothetical protein